MKKKGRRCSETTCLSIGYFLVEIPPALYDQFFPFLWLLSSFVFPSLREVALSYKQGSRQRAGTLTYGSRAKTEVLEYF